MQFHHLQSFKLAKCRTLSFNKFCFVQFSYLEGEGARDGKWTLQQEAHLQFVAGTQCQIKKSKLAQCGAHCEIKKSTIQQCALCTVCWPCIQKLKF